MHKIYTYLFTKKKVFCREKEKRRKREKRKKKSMREEPLTWDATLANTLNEKRRIAAIVTEPWIPPPCCHEKGRKMSCWVAKEPHAPVEPVVEPYLAEEEVCYYQPRKGPAATSCCCQSSCQHLKVTSLLHRICPKWNFFFLDVKRGYGLRGILAAVHH